MAILGKCCCCDLKTGVIILGVFSLILPVIGAILCAFVLALLGAATIAVTQSEDVRNEVQNALNNQDQHSEFNIPNGNQSCSTAECLVQNIGYGAAFFAVFLILFIFYIIVSSLLIHGARKGKAGLLYPYLAVTALSMVLEVGFFISNCVQNGFLVGNFIGMLVSIGLQVFFFLCVFSLGQEIKQRQGNHGGIRMGKI